jgi:twitching motility protein PilT
LDSFAATFRSKPGGALEASFRRGAGAAKKPEAAPVAPAPVAPLPFAAVPVAVTPVGPALDASLRDLLAEAVAHKASDLHLCSGETPTLRIDGRLHPLRNLPAAAVDRILAELAPPDALARLASGSIDRAFELEGVARVRLNLYSTQGRLAAALRLLPPTAPTLASLNIPAPLHELVDAPHGLVLVCGPTGAGKSATLAALAREALQRRGGLLLTIEDPIEYLIPTPESGLVRQRQIGSDVADFPTALRDALREDPNILLVGEMRDAESIELALTAAETGHLVLASMHSRSSASTIERIVDAYPPERQRQIHVQLADALRAVVCQRLLPRARGTGRIPAVEILRGTHSAGALIREGKTEQLSSLIQTSRKEGMLPLEKCLAELVRSQQIERREAMAAANDPASLTAYLQG